jgi:phosphopantothenoylcysteine decarboxylase/phosphopantothenate--cysteine ligase
MGAEVRLIIGPHSLNINAHPNLSVYPVQTAQQMFDQAVNLFSTSDIAIMAAAVADYRPKTIASQKLKKKDENLHIELERTPDIAFHLGQVKRNDQMLVGFALETNNELENANKKLHKKNFDWIVLNSMNDEGAGFKGDTNKVTLIDKRANHIEFPLQSKDELAFELLNQISEDLKL